MKTKTKRILTTVAGVILLASNAFAQSGTWTNVSTSVWSASTNWLGAAAADGLGNTALFTSDIQTNVTSLEEDMTVSLDTPRTIGAVVFADANTATIANWRLNNGGNPANILTLASAGVPVIVVSNIVPNSVFLQFTNGTFETTQPDWQDGVAHVTTLLQGSQGFIKTGPGTLMLSAGNTYSGPTIVQQGMITLDSIVAGNGGGAVGTGTVIITNNATFRVWGGGRNLDHAGATQTTFTNAVEVPTGHVGNWINSFRTVLIGPISGGGTLNFTCAGVRGAFGGVPLNGDANTNFTGTMVFTNSDTGIAEIGFNNSTFINNSWNGFSNTSLVIGRNIIFYSLQNPPNGGATASTQFIPIGSLAGEQGSILGGNPVTGRNNEWVVGYLNTSTTFEGSVRNQGRGAVIGTARLRKVGTGTLIFAGTNNNYTGGSIVAGGTLQVGNGGVFGDVGTGFVAISNNTALVFNRSGAVTVGGVVSGAGTLTVSGGVALTLSGVNTFTSNTTVNAGSVVLAAETGLGANPTVLTANALTLNGGAVRSTVTFAIDDANRGITLGASGGSFNPDAATTLTVANIATGAGNLTMGGAGTLALTAVNTFAGKTAVNAGTLVIAAESGLGSNPGVLTADQLSLNGGTLRSTASLSLSGNRGVTLGASGGTINPDAATVLTVANAVTGAGALTVNGAGTVVLGAPANNNYAGATTISQGTLTIGAGGAIASTPSIAIASGATLNVSASGLALGASQTLTGNGTVIGNVTTAAGAQITPGASIGALNITGNLTMSGGVSNRFEMSSSTNDIIKVTGNLNLSGVNAIDVTLLSSLPAGSYTLISYTGTLSGNAANLVLIGSSFGRNSAALSTATAGQVRLIVTGNPGNLRWVGDGVANNWNTTTTNWFNIGAAIPDRYFDGDNVTFNDSGSQSPNINLVAGFIPGSVTVSGTASYTFAGAGSIGGGASLTHSSSGTLTILTANTYTGPTTISAGNVQVGNGTTVGSLGSGNVINNAALNYNPPATVTQSGSISGTGSVAKQGAGTLVLANNNTYGNTTVVAGTLQVGTGAATGSLGSGSVLNNGALVIRRTGVVTNSGAISGIGSLSITGAVTFALAADNTYSGATIVDTGVLQVGTGLTAGTLGSAISVTTANSGAVAFSRSDDTTNAVVIAGSGRLIQRGPGRVTLTGINTYSGATIVETGILEVGDSGLAGNIGAGVVTNNGVLIFNRADGQAIANNFHGAGSIRYIGAGPTTNTGFGNTYSGGTVISNTFVQIGNLSAGQSGFGSGSITLSNATLSYFASGGADQGLAIIPGLPNAVNIPAGQVGTVLLPFRCGVGGALTGSGQLELRVNGVRGDVLGDWSAFAGQINVTTLAAGNDFRVANAAGMPNAKINLNSVTMYNRLAGNPLLRIGLLTGDATSTINGGGGNAGLAVRLALGALGITTNLDLTSTDAIGSVITLIKEGAGTLTLNNAHFYNGSTVVSNGVLSFAFDAARSPNSIAFDVAGGSLDVSLLTGSTLTLGAAQTVSGYGTVLGAVDSSGGGTVAPGNGIGTLTVTNGVIMGGNAVLEVNRAGSPNADRLLTTSITEGGTITVTNIGGALQPGDTFQLLSTAPTTNNLSGTFATTTLPVLAPGLSWNNTLASNGKITVTGTLPTIANTVSGNTINMNWGAGYLGWKLQLQTNNINTGISTNWVTVPGSEAASTYVLNIDAVNGTVFSRLVFP